MLSCFCNIGVCGVDTMDQSSITPNTSNQQLVINNDNDSATALLQEKPTRIRETLRDVTFLEFMTVAILCFVNLINYMDRFTLAGELKLLLNNAGKFTHRYPQAKQSCTK